MTGTLTIVLASRSNVLLVPTAAVLGSGSSPLVRVLQNGAPVYRSVTTGMATSSLTQITSGLAAGETVVTGVITSAASTTPATTTGGGLGGLGGGGFGGGGGFFRRSSGGGTSSGGSTTGGSSSAAAACRPPVHDRLPRVGAAGVLGPARQPAAQCTDDPRHPHRHRGGGRADGHRSGVAALGRGPLQRLRDRHDHGHSERLLLDHRPPDHVRPGGHQQDPRGQEDRLRRDHRRHRDPGERLGRGYGQRQQPGDRRDRQSEPDGGHLLQRLCGRARSSGRGPRLHRRQRPRPLAGRRRRAVP